MENAHGYLTLIRISTDIPGGEVRPAVHRRLRSVEAVRVDLPSAVRHVAWSSLGLVMGS
jgi:hypothetical protein